MTKKVINKIIKDGQVYYIFGSGGADIDIDSALSTTSENPVQNKVITTELNKKANSNSLGTAASKDTGTSAGNVPLLNSNGKLDDSIIPAVAIVDTYAVTNKSDLLALSAQKGDVGIVSSESKSYILGGTGDPTVEANWLWLKTPSAVNDATISLTQAGESIDSFTVNQATNKTIALRGDIYLTQDEYDALPSTKNTDGNNYHIIDASGTSKRLYSVGATAPENPTQGDLWYDTTEDKFKSYDGSDWNEIGGGGGGGYCLRYMLIGGGGGGYYGGGGGACVLLGSALACTKLFYVNIGGGGAGGGYQVSTGDGGETILSYENTSISAPGGKGGTTTGGGKSGSGCSGGGQLSSTYGGGGGAGGAGGTGDYSYRGGKGGVGICGYAGGGGGAGCCNGGSGTDGGGNAVKCNAGNGCPATTCGSGGGGSYSCRGGSGASGMMEICYLCDGSSGFSSATGGDCCYVCDGYCVHRFTSDGTFQIVN